MARRTWGRSVWSTMSMLWRDKDDDIEDLIVEESYTLGEAPTSGAAPRSGGGKRDPKLSLVKKLGLSFTSGSGAGRDYEPPEYDFTEITNAYNTEGYFRQAADKYIEMMFKADWDFVSKNPNALEYVKMRFSLMAEATQIPTNQLFIEIAEDLVKYCNVIVAKARAKDALPFQGMNVMGVGENMPVAGYFPLNLATMSVRRDKVGTVKGWQQEVEGQDKPVKFKPEDIVHIYYKREKGRAFGTPWLLPALDDIRALRQIEENVLRLVYRNLHPLWHVKVGLESEGLGAEDGEVDLVRAEMENMDVEGGMVTTERVNIHSIASNQIIDAHAYMKHFEQRAFTVMGVSELMMGRGNTANRSTGDNLSGEFKDRIKALQKVMQTFVNEFMVKEILMEGGFDPVLNVDDKVNFRFHEIDNDTQIKLQNQAVFLYEHNAISESEMRELIGRDPIEDGDVRSGMHLQVITLAQKEAEAKLAPAPAAAAGSKPAGGSKKETDNKNKPTNQSGTKSSPKKTTNTHKSRYLAALHQEYVNAKAAVHTLAERHGTMQEAELGGALKYTENQFLAATEHHISQEAHDLIRIPVQRMMGDIYEHVLSSLQAFEGTKEAADIVESVFDVFHDRLGIIGERAFDMHESMKEGSSK